MLTRREFLQRTALVGTASALLPTVFQKAIFAAEQEGMVTPDQATNRTLVVIQMAGGNDGLNTVVPYGDGRYYTARRTTAIPQNQVLTLNSEVGLHPSLTKFKALWDSGVLGIVEGVGYPNPSFSHFDSMRIWQSADPSQKATEGWLGRYFDSLNLDPHLFQGLCVGGNLASSMQSPNVVIPVVQSVAAYQLQGDPVSAQLSTVRLQALRALYTAMPSSTPSAALLRSTLETVDNTSKKLVDAEKAYVPAVQYPNTDLATGLKLIAQAIQADLGVQVCHVAIGGFDTHAAELPAHTRLMTALSESIFAFYQDLKAHGKDKNVVIMTWSEFGRRVGENGSGGTDHGSAAPLFVVGTPVKGGLYGQRPNLGKLDDGNLRFTTDFRSVYKTVLDDWLTAPADLILGGKFESLKMFRTDLA
ncbi:MAG: DUF1501 domain-containing protein [Dehalococcoidia bacterium]|nr:DUF1501 domain-containing protein [Dehalococcoidia bacterium]